MIYDKLENFEKYVSAHPEFKTVAEFMKNNDLLAIPLGKTPINDKVFFNRQSYLGKPDTNKYESHIKYIDVQVVMKGREKIKYSVGQPTITEVNEKDVYFTEADADCVMELENSFAVFFPGELHAPGIGVNDEQVEKIIFKVMA